MFISRGQGPLRPAALGDTCYALSQSRAAWDLYQACAECIVNYLRNVFLYRSDYKQLADSEEPPGESQEAIQN